MENLPQEIEQNKKSKGKMKKALKSGSFVLGVILLIVACFFSFVNYTLLTGMEQNTLAIIFLVIISLMMSFFHFVPNIFSIIIFGIGLKTNKSKIGKIFTIILFIFSIILFIVMIILVSYGFSKLNNN